MENNMKSNVLLRIMSQSVCAGIQKISENIRDEKKPFLTPVSFHKGAENTQFLPPLSSCGQWQCSILFSIDGSNTPRYFFTRQPAGNTSWFGLTTLHTQFIPVTPITIKISDLDPREKLPCYFSDPSIFTVAVAPRLGFQALLFMSDICMRAETVSAGCAGASSSTC